MQKPAYGVDQLALAETLAAISHLEGLKNQNNSNQTDAGGGKNDNNNKLTELSKEDLVQNVLNAAAAQAGTNPLANPFAPATLNGNNNIFNNNNNNNPFNNNNSTGNSGNNNNNNFNNSGFFGIYIMNPLFRGVITIF